MRRSTRLVCAVGLALSMFAPMALAAPPVLDRVPGNAVAAVIVPSIAKFSKKAGDFMTAIEAPIPIPEAENLMLSVGFPENAALDPQKADAAIVFVPPPAQAGAAAGDDEGDEADKTTIFILPVSNYGEFLAGYEIKAAGAGEISSGAVQGQDLFFKDIGNGYVAIAQSKDPLERAKWDNADAAAHRAKIGKGGDSLLDSSDVSWVVFTQEAKQFLPEIEDALEEQIGNTPGAPQLNDLKESPIGQFLTGPIMNDSTGNVTGFRFDAHGISIDNAVTFKEGSETATKLAGITGASRQLLTKLPAQPYLFAAAADLSSPGARRLIDELLAKGGDDLKNDLGGFIVNTVKNSDGGAVAIGLPPGGLMGGPFTSTITYVKTSNPDAFVKNMQESLSALNGTASNGIAFESSFNAGGADIEGTKVDTWAIKMKADPDSDEPAPDQVIMMLPFLFGPTNGPAGYIGRADGGVYQTMGRNQSLMNSALKASKGGENFVTDKVLAKVAEQLPTNSVFELYVGAKGILESAVPLIAQFTGVAIDAEIPPSLPPIGLGVAGAEQGVVIGAYLPAQTLKTIVAIAMEMQAAQMGEEEEPAPGKKNDGGKGAGQPRF